MKILLGSVLSLLMIFLIMGCSTSKKQDRELSESGSISDGKFAEIPSSPNAVSSQTVQESKLVDPLVFRGGRQESLERMLKAFKIYGTHELVSVTDNYIHAVFITGFFRFRDDVELYFDEEACLIHYRSASRVGYSDMGLNRKRYNELRRIYMKD